MTIQDHYQKAIRFAAQKHTDAGQTVPGSNLPYVVHISNVAMEILATATHNNGFDIAYAVQLALLHDTIEDTDASFEEIAAAFGNDIAIGVAALTKDEQVDKSEKMKDSINRIKQCRNEVWMVKLADRITNMQVPPAHWSSSKKLAYKLEAELLLHELGDADIYLKNRLAEKIEVYKSYIDDPTG